MTSKSGLVTCLLWRSKVLLALVVALLVGSLGCRNKGVLVLVVDSDMAVPAELDHLDVFVSGPSEEQGPLSVSLGQPGDLPLPRTLGLVDAASSSQVTISVVGSRGSTAFASQRVQTRFVDEETRMVRVVLSAACQGVLCDDDVQTCSEGACVPVERPPSALPPWTGTLPASPGPLPGEEELLWSAGWQNCAPKGGTLYCWGINNLGQLGNQRGSSDTRFTRRLPVVGLIPKPSPPTTVAVGYRHACVCDGATGVAYCWGANDEGQTGQPISTAPQYTPMAVPGVTGCKTITAGGSHTCVVRSTTGVMCWGRNAEGQLGLPASTTPSPTPRSIPNLNGVSDVKAGEKFTCATRTSGGMYCWGDNEAGQLGDGTKTSRGTNMRVNLPADANGAQPAITEMAIGRLFACALTDNQTVYCWGENTDGMIGSQAATAVTMPVQIPELLDAIHITAGHQHACAVRGVSRTVSCWGSSQYGQLGNNMRATSPSPVPVVGLTDVTALSAGVVHTCARNLTGVYCWGQNINAQLGDGSLVDEDRPVHTIGF